MSYSLLDLANMDAPAPELVEDGEYILQITNAEKKLFGTGREGYETLIKIPSEPNSKLIVFRIFLDMDGDDDRKIKGFARKVQNFFAAFTITDTEPTTWIGKEATGILKTVVDSEYGDKNEIRRFITPA